ncbi:MAG: hypothetical protein O7I42_05710 [Alphaproteobacteria bacterium]|nr:hypothetical protein [Alphaproteobacteria bacterium]
MKPAACAAEELQSAEQPTAPQPASGNAEATPVSGSQPATTEPGKAAPAEVEPAASGTAQQGLVKVNWADTDSLHILPLAIVPLQSPALQRARMIKNSRLKSVIELFNVDTGGSGQIEVEAVPKEFGWSEDEPHPDLLLLRKLKDLPSYDVYSLRILLRSHGISVSDSKHLKLSSGKSAELSEYMTDFTMPLIKQIYGEGEIEIKDFGDVVGLFRDPDISKAREKLSIMAEKLEIGLEEVPSFLEDYGDIFLSLSYYRQCLDGIEPIISNFLESLPMIRENWQLRKDTHLMSTCAMIESKINGLMAAITGRFENFDRSTGDMWSQISASRFQKVKALIESYHTTIGGVLCSLSLIMGAWDHHFPSKDAGGPNKRAGFIMSELKQGIENIQKIEDSAPMLSEL